MITAVFQLFAAVPAATLALVIFGAWLLRRRPGRLRHGWLLGFGLVLVGADNAEELPLPDAEPPADPAGMWGTSTPTRHTVEVGMGGGSFQTCSGARTYGDLGAMYRYSTPISDQTNLEVRGGGYGAYSGNVSGGVRASVGVDHRWAAARLGVIAGALYRESTLESPVLPTAAVRLGPRDVFFAEGAFVDDSPAPLPGPIASVGVGVAFPALGNRWEPFLVRAGVSGMGFYLAPTIPLGELGNLEILGAYGDDATWGASGVLRIHMDAER